ncbi:MAG: DUF1294 domain-containing protein [Turicibacter sp.]|nr:DUF1294 domain-containing protein [Turicibacter sp.]
MGEGMQSYFILVSSVAVVLMVYDKRAAVQGKRRVRERTLLLVASLGGALAMWVAMHRVRHKTGKPKFSYGVPILFVIQLLLLFLQKT